MLPTLRIAKEICEFASTHSSDNFEAKASNLSRRIGDGFRLAQLALSAASPSVDVSVIQNHNSVTDSGC
jgi:hypothetical protein